MFKPFQQLFSGYSDSYKHFQTFLAEYNSHCLIRKDGYAEKKHGQGGVQNMKGIKYCENEIPQFVTGIRYLNLYLRQKLSFVQRN
jgi:hypothetical protein